MRLPVRHDVTRIRQISTALLVMSLGLQAQSQTASPPPPGAAPAPSQVAPKGGINALLDSVRTGGDDFLPPDRAFRFDALPDGTDRVRLNWEIADGYYLYRARIKVMTPSTRAQLGAPQMPQGQIKTDEYFGRQEVYHHELVATVAVLRASGGAFELPLQVTDQGCADAGLCYPPITKNVTVNLSAGAASPVSGSPGSSASGHPGGAGGGGGEQDLFHSLIRTGNPLVMLGWFYLAGLVLAFTPCVLPMVPILSGIIAGGGRTLTTTRAFALSVTYVLGMALTYTLAGIACAAAGRQVQAVFQQWWVLALFAALFVVLALSMFCPFPPAESGRDPDPHCQHQQPPVRRHLRRSRRHGGALGSHRHHLRGTGARWSAARDQSDRAGGARWRGPFGHVYRHGHAVAGGRRLGGPAAAKGRTLDGAGEKALRRDDAGGRGVDARAHRAGARGALVVGGARADPCLAPVVADARPFCRHVGAARRGRDRRPVRSGPYGGVCAPGDPSARAPF